MIWKGKDSRLFSTEFSAGMKNLLMPRVTTIKKAESHGAALE